MVRLRTALALLVVLLGGMAPAVAQQRSERAKAAFYDGRKAYESGDYQRAYDLFKQSYILSQEPALLYNIAAALQAMERPADAARALRDYLEAVPTDPEKAALERRIAALDKAQALMERDRRESAPRPATTPPPVPAPDGKLSPEAQQQLDAQAAREAETRRQLDALRSELKSQRSLDGDLIGRLNRQLESDRRKRRNLAIGLSIGGVVIVGAAVGLAIFLTREPKDTSTPADLGPFTSTE